MHDGGYGYGCWLKYGISFSAFNRKINQYTGENSYNTYFFV